MDPPKSLRHWLQTANLSVERLAEQSGVPLHIVKAILSGGYTSSPQQRRRIADVFGLAVEDIAWGTAMEPTPMYGHGPQFGRSP